MKKLIYIVTLSVVLTSCHSNKKQKVIVNTTEDYVDKPIKKEIPKVSIHGEINKESLNKYYPKVTDSITEIKTLVSEKVNMDPENSILVSLLHNTGTFDQMILCTHNKNLELIDYLHIGKATDFDNGKSKTIEHTILDRNIIVFDKVDWGYVEKGNEPEIVRHEKLVVEIGHTGHISSRKKNIEDLSILNFQKSFKTKNEFDFLNQFPNSFKQFSSYFGWNHDKNSHEVLYYEANEYIDYWFDLLNIEKNKKYENQIIDICTNAEWDADGVSYFQHKAFNYIKEKETYGLINQLNDKKAKSVLFFLFDGPHPEFDKDFNSNLNSEKKKILKELFRTGLFDNNENPDPVSEPKENISTSYNISDFIDTEHYFIKDIDINNDGTLDKIVSADPYQGDELFLFIGKNDTYKFVLKTINFSEDGGNQIVDIKQSKTGFVVVTAFPDRGFLEAWHHISLKENRWMLTNTIYKTLSSNQEDAFIYACNVKQDIDISDTNFLDTFKLIPKNSDREKMCSKIMK